MRREGYELIRRYLAPQRGTAVLMAISLLLSTALEIAGPQVVRAFIDDLTRHAPAHVLQAAALLYLAITGGRQAAGVVAGYLSQAVAWTSTNALRGDLLRHLLGLDRSFFQAHPPGELLERADADVEKLSNLLSAFGVHVAGNAVLLAGIVAAILAADRRFGIAFAAFAASAVALLAWVRRPGVSPVRRERERSADFYGFLGEVLRAGEDLRANGATAYVQSRLCARIRAWYPVLRRATLARTAVWVAAVGAFAIGDTLAYGLGGALYHLQSISLGQVYMAVAYAAMIAQPIESIRTHLQDLQGADASLGRLRELLGTRSPVAGGWRHPPVGALSVEFIDVSFAYGDAVALQGVSFRLAAGRTLGVVGPTGGGKTTLARLLCRACDPTEGSVRIGGADAREYVLGDLRRRVGFVPQDVRIFDASLRDNVALFDPAVADARIQAAFRALGLPPERLDASVSPRTVSAGEAQLIALSRVFLKDPGLVVLDEASSRLDPLTAQRVDAALARLAVGRTVIVIAHRLSAVAQADDLLVLGEGRVLEHGARAGLAADPSSQWSRLLRRDAE